MPDSVESPAPESTTTPPPLTRSTRSSNVPRSCVSSGRVRVVASRVVAADMTVDAAVPCGGMPFGCCTRSAYVGCPRLPVPRRGCDRTAPQLRLAHLRRGGARQLVDELDVARTGEARQYGVDALDELCAVEARAGDGDHREHHLVLGAGRDRGHGIGGHLGDTLERRDRALDLERGDVLASPSDAVLGAVHEGHP